jgi:putative transposase
MRVTRSRELVAEGYRPSVVARVAQISRQAIYRTPRRRRSPASPQKPPADEVNAAIVEIAVANPADGYRMVTALARRRLGRRVNRKRTLRVMRERRLIQRRRPLGRRRRPGFFRVERPDQLWHLDMTSVWVAEHGWVYLMAAIDCCTREIVAWQLETRCRAAEAIALIERAAAERRLAPGTLTLGTDNGSAFTARAFKTVLSGLGIAHRRGGYRDPESEAFIESWFGKLKERCVWREEFETLDQARQVIGNYVDRCHDRPHSRLDYNTPREVAATWNDGGQPHLTQRPNTVNADGEHVSTSVSRPSVVGCPSRRSRVRRPSPGSRSR